MSFYTFLLTRLPTEHKVPLSLFSSRLQMKELRKALTEIGLSSNSIELYLESYQRGRATIGQLAKSLKMDRSSAYLAYEQLTKEGLVEEDNLRSVKEIWASPPESVSRIIQSRAKELEDSVKSIAKHLPELSASYGARQEKPVLQSFTGRDSLKRISEDVLNSGVDLLRVITNQNAERKVFSANAHDNFIMTRMKKGMKAHVLAADTKEAKFLQRFDKDELRETHIVTDLLPFKHEVYIYGDKVAVLGFETNIFGFIVQDKQFATLQSYMFDVVWMRNNPQQ